MRRSAGTGGDMRRRAGLVRASEKECRIRRRHEKESRSSKGELGGVQEQEERAGNWKSIR